MGKKVADFIQLRIVSVFGVPKIVVSYNATSMSNNLVTSACAALGIRKSTISPYSAKSNLQELSNRIILDTMRAFTANHYARPEQAAGIIGPIVNLINSLSFTDQRIISPYYLQFAEKPKNDVIIFYDMPGKAFESMELYLKDIIKINSVVTNIRLAHIQARKYTSPTDKVKRYHDKIQEGSIVSIKNPELVVRKQDFKLWPKFKNRFLVMKRKNTAVLLLPCIEIYLESYFQQNKG